MDQNKWHHQCFYMHDFFSGHVSRS